ncbi:MAG: fimbrillin family protein [Bacteroidales bacterium]|nr:fimbrillin family protein [Bacteroidales bacterium]
MNKYFIIIATVALAASAACTKVETNETPAQKVTFAAANYVPQTKAGPVSLTSETTSFKSKGFLHAEGVSDAQNFFGTDGETISWNSTAKEWAPTHDYYWPKGASSYINFVSWYDKNGAPTTANETSLVWTIDGSTRTLAADDNIMYADEAWRFKANNNPATYGLDDVSQGVPTLFHHALAQLQIQARATKVTNGTATWTITLKDLAISGVYNTATLSLSNSDPNEAKKTKAWSGSWATTGSTGTLSPVSTDLALSTSNQNVLNVQSVIPQSLGATAVLSFNLEIVTTYANSVSNKEIISKSIPFYATTGDAFSSTINAWAQNTKYVYTLVVEPSENRVLFDPAVEENWQVVTVPEKTI